MLPFLMQHRNNFFVLGDTDYSYPFWSNDKILIKTGLQSYKNWRFNRGQSTYNKLASADNVNIFYSLNNTIFEIVQNKI
jgi:hypothetical protein